MWTILSYLERILAYMFKLDQFIVMLRVVRNVFSLFSRIYWIFLLVYTPNTYKLYIFNSHDARLHSEFWESCVYLGVRSMHHKSCISAGKQSMVQSCRGEEGREGGWGGELYIYKCIYISISADQWCCTSVNVVIKVIMFIINKKANCLIIMANL